MKDFNQKNLRNKFLKLGVKMIGPETVFFSNDTKIGKNVTIEPYVVIGSKVKIGNSVIIKSFSHLESCKIENKVEVGPYARIRPNTILKEGSKIGNFVEIKKSIVGKKSKVNHLNLLLKTLHNSNTGGETNISNLLHGLAESINKKGLIILISDLLDDEKRVMESLRHFRYRGHEIIVFHIVDPKEKNLDYNENINFIDLENNYNIVADSRLVKDKYNKAFRNFSDFYKKECLRDKIDYNLISTSDSLDKTLLQYLIRRSQINK